MSALIIWADDTSDVIDEWQFANPNGTIAEWIEFAYLKPMAPLLDPEGKPRPDEGVAWKVVFQLCHPVDRLNPRYIQIEDSSIPDYVYEIRDWERQKRLATNLVQAIKGNPDETP